MIRIICGALALAACTLSVFAGTPRQDDSASLPMRFGRFVEGPAEACGANCRVLVAASGMIAAETPKDFETFARSQDLRGATVVIDSKGGSVHGAIALGRAIRGLGLATTIGRVREAASRDGLKRGQLLPHGECQSMCAFVILGGVRRFVPTESRVLVHQIWLGDRRDDAAAAQYSAEDLVLVQRDIGQLVQYTAEMGGGTELIELALRIPPWEPMRALSRDELRRTRLDTTPDRYSRASAESVSSAVAVPASDGQRMDSTERGWTLAERAGRAVLVRQHPLTIEGERIGAFEVALACGPSADSLDVTYAETRSNVDDPTATLRQVEMRIEGQSSSLEIVASHRKSGARELQTLAAGVLPASVVRSFADASLDALTVQTASSINPATVIRVGNNGFAQNFSRLEAACGGQQTRANTHARLDPGHAESAGSVR
jgi:hypothetical protein